MGNLVQTVKNCTKGRENQYQRCREERERLCEDRERDREREKDRVWKREYSNKKYII